MFSGGDQKRTMGIKGLKVPVNFCEVSLQRMTHIQKSGVSCLGAVGVWASV